MTDLHCSECGTPLPEGLDGLCPRCLWADSMGGGEAPVPGHRLGDEIARGGMGIVYTARQESPERQVAVKMLRPHLLEQAAMKERFRQEATAAAALQHPGILPVYQVGETDGVPWFTMMLAEGGTLAARREHYQLQWRETAQLMAHLSRAVGHAHERGVLHRDLKPGNILFDAADRAYVCDFGLAKVATAGESTPDWTLSVQLLGTPHYLPPEVAAGTQKQTTTAGDIYSLGVILYELLAGHPPFDAENIPALLRKIADEEPASLTQVARPVARRSETGSTPLPPGSTLVETRNASAEGEVPADAGLLRPVSAERSETGEQESSLTEPKRRATGGRATGAPPADLAAIAMKCLEKNPARRYATAAALADDLDAWLAGKAVTARRLSGLQKAGRWVRRNPLVTGLAAALALALAAAAVLGIRHQLELKRALTAATLSEARLRSQSTQTGRRFDVMQSLARVKDIAPPADLRTRLAGALAASDMRALNEWPVHVPHFMTQMDFSADLSQCAVPVPEGGVALMETSTQRKLRHYPAPAAELVQSLQLSDDGQWLGFSTGTGRVEIHSLSAAGSSPLMVTGDLGERTRFTFSPDGRSCLVVNSAAEGLLLDLTSGMRRPLSWTVSQGQGRVEATPGCAAFSPDSQRIALICDRMLRVIRATDGAEVWSAPHGYLNGMAVWSPDGTQVVVSEAERLGVLSLHDAATGKETGLETPSRAKTRQVTFLPDGQSLLLLAWDGKLTWLSISREGSTPVELPAGSHALRLSRDGLRLGYSPGAGLLGIAELSPSPVLHRWVPPPLELSRGFVTAVSPDGKWLANAEMHGIRLYSTAARREVTWLPLPPSEWHRSIDFCGDSRGIFTGTISGQILHFPLDGEADRLSAGEARVVVAKDAPVIQEFAANGRDLVVKQESHDSRNARVTDVTAQLWLDGDPQRARTLLARGQGRDMVGFRLVPGTNRGVSASLFDPDILLWDTTTGLFVRGLGLAQKASCDISRDGRLLVSFCAGEYRLWNTSTWEPTARWSAPGEFHGLARFMPDGRSVAVPAGPDGQIELRRTPDGQFLAALPLCGVVSVKGIEPSPDGGKIYLRTEHRQILEWDLAALESVWSGYGVPIQ